MYRDTSSVDCAPRELTQAISHPYGVLVHQTCFPVEELAL